jgi:hypothetical protein
VKLLLSSLNSSEVVATFDWLVNKPSKPGGRLTLMMTVANPPPASVPRLQLTVLATCEQEPAEGAAET